MFGDKEERIRQELCELQMEHKALGDLIHRIAGEATVDQLQIRRLKKTKLRLKDQIEHLRSELIPDLDA